jgi:hypothetical protein
MNKRKKPATLEEANVVKRESIKRVVLRFGQPPQSAFANLLRLNVETLEWLAYRADVLAQSSKTPTGFMSGVPTTIKERHGRRKGPDEYTEFVVRKNKNKRSSVAVIAQQQGDGATWALYLACGEPIRVMHVGLSRTAAETVGRNYAVVLSLLLELQGV